MESQRFYPDTVEQSRSCGYAPSMGNPSIQGEGGSCLECARYRFTRTQPVHGTFVVCERGDFHGNAGTGCRYWEPRKDGLPEMESAREATVRPAAPGTGEEGGLSA